MRPKATYLVGTHDHLQDRVYSMNNNGVIPVVNVFQLHRILDIGFNNCYPPVLGRL